MRRNACLGDGGKEASTAVAAVVTSYEVLSSCGCGDMILIGRCKGDCDWECSLPTGFGFHCLLRTNAAIAKGWAFPVQVAMGAPVLAA